MNATTSKKREELALYIDHEVSADAAIQGIVVIGSVAKGIARADSDIDAIVFLDPFDLYAVPAEAKWQVKTGRFHGIFSDVRDFVQLDFKRVDLREWSDSAFTWPESLCAELSEGWVAFDRFGRIQPLIRAKTKYNDVIRQNRLDDAISHLNWLLSEAETGRPWDTVGAMAAHYRLQSACDYLVQALFAYNQRWRTLRSRELTDLLALPWLPTDFEAEFFQAMHALSADKQGYQQRVSALSRCHNELMTKCLHDGIYIKDAVSEAFIRMHDEPGRNWNMDEWELQHNARNDTA